MSLECWVEVFWRCHNIIDGSVAQWSWADGLPLMEQQALTVDMFMIMRNAAQSWVNDSMEAAQKSNE